MMKIIPYTVSRREGGMALLPFLAHRLGVSKNKAKALLDSRAVFVNGQRVWMAHHQLRSGDVVTAAHPAQSGPPASITILFHDAHYVIVNKPPGILSNEKNSVESLLQRQLNQSALRAAHRLDRDTSGCLLIARNQEAMDRAAELFRRHQVRKIYHALVAGRVHPPEQTITLPIEGGRTVTHLRVLDLSKTATHLAIKIDTGRTHQIRRHLATLGHPVLGDKSYGAADPEVPEFMEISRQMLHAQVIEFSHPFTGERVRAETPLPKDFRACMARLRLT